MFEAVQKQLARAAIALMPSLGKSFINPSFDELGIMTTDKPRIPEARFGNYDKYLAAMADEPWVYSCVSRVAYDVSTAPICLYKNKDKKIKVASHPVLDLLKRPNARMNFAQLLEWTQTSLDLAGNAYWKLDDIDGSGMPHTIWPVIPSLVEIDPDPNPRVFIKAYKYHVKGQIIAWDPASVVQFKYHNPDNYYYGLAPLSAARMSVDTHRASSKWNLRFFDNSARPDLVFSTPHALDPSQRLRMLASWNAHHRGEGNAHNPAFLEKGTTVEVVGVHQKDMDFILQKKISREEICSIFKVPPALVGLFEYANYANAEEQEKIYWRSTAVPSAQKLLDFINEFFLPLFDPTGQLVFGIDLSQIRAIQEDDEKRSKYIRQYWEMGVPLNALIDAYALPFPHVPGGDLSYVPVNYVPADNNGPQYPANDPAKPPQAPEGPSAGGSTGDGGGKAKNVGEHAGKGIIKPTRAMLQAKHHRFLLLAENLSKPFKALVKTHFTEQKDAVIRAIREAGSAHVTTHSAGLSLPAEKEKLGKLMLATIIRSVHAGRDSEALLLHQMTGKLSLKPDVKAIDRIKKWSETKSFAWAEDINKTTFKKVDDALQESLDSGESVDQAAQRIADVFDQESDYRTERIAQTEMIASLNEGALEAYRANDQVERKGWLATMDEVTRVTHQAAGEDYGEEGIPVADDFKVGDGAGPAPGQIGLPEEDINCRCAVFPLVKADAGS